MPVADRCMGINQGKHINQTRLTVSLQSNHQQLAAFPQTLCIMDRQPLRPQSDDSGPASEESWRHSPLIKCNLYSIRTPSSFLV